jgi:uncharacterized protein Yka (UPF0111/DUF47 family)
MSANTDTVLTRLVDRIFPRTPDFYRLLNEQCDVAVEAMNVFVEFMESGDLEKAKEVRALEKRGDVLKARNTDLLSRAFSTPMDREDIYRAIATVDHIINYAKTTTREIEVLMVEPDKYMLEFAVLLREGAEALQRGYRKLAETPSDAEADAQAARKAERSTEKAYRRAIADLFNPDNISKAMECDEEHARDTTICMVIAMFKRREIYRHMSNASDRLARAGEVLHDIVVKIS